MGPDLSCFDWSNLASSYLDGSLAPGAQKAADQHLSDCADCRGRQQRYRLILDSLRSLDRIPAPAKIKYERELAEPGAKRAVPTRWPELESRLRPVLRPILQPLKGLNARSWAWIIFSVLGFVTLTSLPKLRALYESRLQKRLDAVNFAELPITQASGGPAEGDSEPTMVDDFGGEESDEEDSASSDGTGGEVIHTRWDGEWDPSKAKSGGSTTVGAQVWRFILRTDSPQDMRGRIQESLIKAGAAPTAKMIHGFTAPGGIQFDVLLPSDSIDDLKKALKELSDTHAPSDDSGAAENPFPTEPFTWYRNRSKRPLPQGAARVIIWLSLT